MKKWIFSFLSVFSLGLLSAQTTLSLQDCLDMALKQNADMQIRQEEVKMAGYKKNQAKSAYFPKLDASFSYLRMSDEMYLLSEDKFLPIGTKMADGSFGFRADQINNQWTMIDGNPVPLDANGTPFNPKTNPEKIEWKDYTTIPKDELVVDMRNTYIGALTLVQPIYMGGKIYQTNKMAQIGVDIAKEQQNAEIAEVLFNTENNYWTVISLSNKEKIFLAYQKLLNQLNGDVAILFNEGMATKSDVLKVKVKLNEVNVNLTKTQNGFNLAKMQLCRQIGFPMTGDIVLTDEISEQPENKTTAETLTSIEQVYGNRFEIKSLEKLIDLSEAKKKLAVSDYLPEVGLIANYMYTNPDFFNGFKKDFSGSWNVGITMKIPILHWGEQKQKVRTAKSERFINELKLDDAKEKIELQYRQAIYKVEESNKKLMASNSNLEQAEENLKYAKLAYEEGLVGITDVLDAQGAWFVAYSDKADAQIELKLNHLYLKKTMGELVINN